jgi:hypothetical protein
VLIVLTALIAAAGIFRARASRVRSKRRLRAYVRVSEAWLDYPLKGPPVGWVRITNAGETPASNVRASIRLHIGSSAFDGPSAIRPPDNTAGFPLEPGSSRELFAPPDRRTTSPEVGRRAYVAPTYVYGVIAYRDAFGADQTTTFRFGATANLTYSEDVGHTKALALDGEGNDAT